MAYNFTRAQPQDKTINFLVTIISTPHLVAQWVEVLLSVLSGVWRKRLMQINEPTIIFNSIETTCNKHVPLRRSVSTPGKPKIPRDRRILMRKRRKIQAKLENIQSHITKEKLQTNYWTWIDSDGLIFSNLLYSRGIVC